MTPSNYHTHTTYCHGADTPEQLILRALELGCPEIGFTCHAYTSFDDSYCMSLEKTEQYRAEIRALAERYKHRIKVLLGVEQDIYSDLAPEGYDYVIGSVHYLYRDGQYLSIDESEQKQKSIIEQYYGGDPLAFAEHYFETVSMVHAKTGCDIVGHFDLVTKFNEGDALFDTSSRRYRAAALSALDVLCATPAVFEINTGAIARGCRTTPYPADFIISELKKRGVRLIFSSDCHDRDMLLFGYDIYLDKIK